MAMPYKTKALQRRYQRGWLQRRRREWIASKGGVCRACGGTDRLEAHHIDPRTKISHNVWSWTAERRIAELAKCEVLCHDCHLKETQKQVRERFPIRHGTTANYRRGCRCAACRSVAVGYTKSLPTKRSLLHSLTINQLLQRKAK